MPGQWTKEEGRRDILILRFAIETATGSFFTHGTMGEMGLMGEMGYNRIIVWFSVCYVYYS